MVRDNSEGIRIVWNVQGKISEIIPDQVDPSVQKPYIRFSYDTEGNRIKKTVYMPSSDGDWVETPQGPGVQISKLSRLTEEYYIRDASGNVMSIARRDITSLSGLLETKDLPPYPTGYTANWQFTEHSLYGSDRLGTYLPTRQNINLEITDLKALETHNIYTGLTPVTPYTGILAKRSMGMRRFELKDHLGNIRATVSDKKLNTTTPQLLTVNNYYPFGMLQPGRHSSTESYRYGFNGKEMDNEATGGKTGSIYDYGFRVYNPLLGKFLSVDPLFKKYPWYSSYQFAGNIPIAFVDIDGLEPGKYKLGPGHGRVVNVKKTAEELKADMKVYNMMVAKYRFKRNEDGSHYFPNMRNSEANSSASYELHDSPRKNWYKKESERLTPVEEYEKEQAERYAKYKCEMAIELQLEKEYELKKNDIFWSGTVDIALGATGLISATVEEIGTSGGATAIVITQIIWSADKLTGGIGKVLNPENYVDTEAKPVKYLLGRYLGENGEDVYDIIDISTGTVSIPKAKKLIDIVGVYDTMNSAKEFKERKMNNKQNDE
jgi:RHS repeat-associated protein